MEITKKWYQSRTIIIALLMAATGVITAFETQYPSVGILITTKAFFDIALRFATSTTIE